MSEKSNRVPSQAKVLHQLYLKLFLRGRSARGQTAHRTSGSIVRRLSITLLFYILAGVLSLRMIDQPLVSLSIYLHGATIFFVGMFIASSSGEVLFNREESEILLHRPVEPRTLLWAKVSVLLQVSLWMSLAFNLVGLWVGAAGKFGSWRFIPAHLVSATVSACFCTAFVILVYQVCLRFFGRERLDGLMTLAQVLMTMLLVFGGQVAPRLVGLFPSEIRAEGDGWWLVLLPPSWFAALDLVLVGRSTPTMWSLAAFGVVATAGLLWLAFGRLASSYEIGLRRMADTSSKAQKPEGARTRNLTGRLEKLPGARWFLRDPIERAGFLLVAAYILRDRDVKLRLYPGLAPIFMMPIVLLLSAGRDESSMFIFAMISGYISVTPLLAMKILQQSQQYQAADVFRVLPLHGPGRLIAGGRKAVEVIFMLPLILLMAGVLVWWTDDLSALKNLLPGILSIPVFGRITSLGNRSMPLASPLENAKAANRGLLVLLAMLAAMVIGGLGGFASYQGYLPHFIAGELGCVVVVCHLIDRRARSLHWPSIDDA